MLLYTIGQPWPVQNGVFLRCALEAVPRRGKVRTVPMSAPPAPQQVEGVPALRAGVNPATWMLEVSTLNKEHELGVDFAQIYRTSALFRCAAGLSEPWGCQLAMASLCRMACGHDTTELKQQSLHLAALHAAPCWP